MTAPKVAAPDGGVPEPARFYRPETLSEALELRATHNAVPLAGGTDLLVRHRSWAGTLPRLTGAVIYIGHLPELKGVESGADGTVRIGAVETYATLLAHRSIPELLKRAMAELAAPGLRSVATLAGNVCNASPAADAVCALYALGCAVEVASPSGERTVPVQSFVTGPGRSTLGADEIVTALHLRIPREDRVYYHKVGTRRANALSKLSVCGWATIEGGGISAVGLAVGAVAPTIVRVPEAEALLVGTSTAEAARRTDAVVAAFEPHVRPISDQRSTAAYRRRTALGLIGRFVDGLAD
jgi:CO/xanthine dehydrogenase FAD-binding subunit